MRRFAHVLVVGGSGMLAKFCRNLAEHSDAISVLARNQARIRAISPAIMPIEVDYNDASAAVAVLDACVVERGRPDLLVAWVHGRQPVFRQKLAALVREGGRFVQVLGSAHGDPSRPDRLEAMKSLAAHMPLVYQAVVLGFVMEGARARWLTDDEISDGVYRAIETGAPLSIVGTVEPWSARP